MYFGEVDMHRMMWLRIGGKRLHLLKLAGAFFVLAAVLMVAQSAYHIFVVVDKANMASMRPELIQQLFGWSIGAPFTFSAEDILGVLLGPVAEFLFWLGIALVALMVYQSGRIVVPIEEYEQTISEHHKKLISSAVRRRGKRR